MVVILVVLTDSRFKFSLFISRLLAKAIPVRGARFRKADVERHLLFAFQTLTTLPFSSIPAQ
ncbi:hypothetical protein FXN80_08590 [Dickeya fangzhongdai]|uniref:hypothetical protein n=1 Tax=Dickeya fangzhongdai TaxID=1778540 RepID=UPI0013F8740E|nr:hypothetical protein [Dickeya fangzhongdai]UMB78436.1 hypothetical protein FXN80_08590 [Dickeya fangzhongdai]